MKIHLRSLLLALALTATAGLAQAADVKISALPAASAAAGTEEVPVNQSGTTAKMTTAQIKTFTSSSPTLVTPSFNTAASVAGNALALTATAPAAAASTTAGVAATLTASAATAGSSNAGAAAGGSVTITAGAAAQLTSGNANGGGINLTTGAGIGTGTAGQVNLTNAGVLAAPALILASDTGTGWRRNTTDQWTFTSASTNYLTIAATKIQMGSTSLIGMGSSSSTTAPDVAFGRTASGVGEINTGTLGTYGQLALAGTQGNATLKTLTESVATTFVKVSVATGSFVSGAVDYGIEANDASDFQVRGGIIPFTAVNKAGTITCTVGTVGTATEVASVSTGTLTNTFTCADAGSGVLDLKANAVSSLTQTTLRIRYRVNVLGTTTVAAQ